VVRETKTLDELIESARGIAMSREELRVQLLYGNTTIASHVRRARPSRAAKSLRRNLVETGEEWSFRSCIRKRERIFSK
jgi:hypothetical protein